MIRFRQYTALRSACTSFALAVISATALGCHGSDPRTVRGALAAAARALETGDARAFFPIIDQRTRSAMASIVKSRQRAAALIASDYPEPERSAALAALGDAASAQDAADLFTRRCPASCLAQFEAALGAPLEDEPPAGTDEIEVHTLRGGRLVLHRGQDRWWGIVWNLQPMHDERTRAARELVQIQHNAEVYRKRRALE